MRQHGRLKIAARVLQSPPARVCRNGQRLDKPRLDDLPVPLTLASASTNSPGSRRLAAALAFSVAGKAVVLVMGLTRLHPALTAALVFAPDFWLMAGLLIPNSAIFMPVLTRFATDQREVWLTIDDGPEPATTLPMLDLLDRHNARATFFVIGTKVSAHAGLVREIVRRGHTLGNHTQNHPLATFWLAGPQRAENEVAATNAALRAAGVGSTPWFRAPAGIKSLFLHPTLNRHGQVLVGWSARGREQLSSDPAPPLLRLKKRITPGAILLVHESARHAEPRLALLEGLLEHLDANGYRCVTPAPADLR